MTWNILPLKVESGAFLRTLLGDSFVTVLRVKVSIGG